MTSDQLTETPPQVNLPARAVATIIERLQEALVEKIRDVPADDLEKVREYIREIKALEAEKPEPPAAT